MSVLEMIPGTGDWLLARIGPRVELKIRKELRRLQHDVDATFVGLWLSTTRGDVLVDFAGEVAIAPSSCPFITTTVPTFETFVGADGDEHEAIVHRPRLGRGMPRLGLLAADAPAVRAPALFDAIAASGERIEEILVDVV